MQTRTKIISTLLFLFGTLTLSAQWTGPRLFWDLPEFYATAPDVQNIDQQAGLGLGTAFNVATYWGTIRAGGGGVVTVNPSADQIQESFIITPYLLAEGGLGIYRTNGNKCRNKEQTAYTAMAVIGLRYDIETGDPVELKPDEVDPYGLHWGVGAELGIFLIKDVFKNTEVVLRGTYYPELDRISATFGFKFFLNMREAGRR